MINQTLEIKDEILDNHTCTICMKEDLNNDEIYYTNCDHEFCKDCLDDWFQRGNKSCPLCRGEITEYKHQNEKFKLIIHTVENDIQANERSLNHLINNSLAVRDIVKKNIRLRFYCFTLGSLLLYTLNNYFYNLQDINELVDELNSCHLNNTHLQEDINTYELYKDNNLNNGYYISMYNGEILRRCFFPLKFYNICFNK